MSQFYAIIPAAGIGKRFGGAVKKQFLTLKGRSILNCSVEAFLKTKLFSRIVVCLPPDELVQISGKTEAPEVVYVAGGSARSESVKRGFDALDPKGEDFVLVHDAVRPLAGADLIRRIALAVREKGVVVPGLPVSDTVKEVDGDKVIRTLDRTRLMTIQTPQGFPASVLLRIYGKLDVDDARWTDEAAMAEAIGEMVHLVEGERRNIKVTTADDLKLAEALCG